MSTNFTVEKTKFDKVFVFTPKIHEDVRGKTVEIFNKFDLVEYLDRGEEFVQETVSYSSKNVLRGMHSDMRTWKLVKVLKGRVLLYIVDIRKGSSTYLKNSSFILADSNMKSILLPPSFLNGHLVLSEEGVVFHYNLTTYYTPKQITVRYDEPKLKLNWPIKDPILSERDMKTNLNEIIDEL